MLYFANSKYETRYIINVNKVPYDMSEVKSLIHEALFPSHDFFMEVTFSFQNSKQMSKTYNHIRNEFSFTNQVFRHTNVHEFEF